MNVLREKQWRRHARLKLLKFTLPKGMFKFPCASVLYIIPRENLSTPSRTSSTTVPIITVPDSKSNLTLNNFWKTLFSPWFKNYKREGELSTKRCC